MHNAKTMRWLSTYVGVAALLGAAYAQDPDSHVVVDTETGFTFGEYISDQGITYRLAIPDQAPTTGGYDAVVQNRRPPSPSVGLVWPGAVP